MPMETRADLRVIRPSLPPGVQNRNTQPAQRRRVELPSKEVRKPPGLLTSSSLHATAFPSGVMRASVLLLPLVVNCNSRPLDKSLTQTSHWPVCLDILAILFPSKEVRKPPGLLTSSSLHATAFPSGVMRASVLLLPLVVNCNSCPLDKSLTQTSHWPVRLDRIAILFPSAETDSMTVLEIPSVKARRSLVSLPVLGSSGTR